MKMKVYDGEKLNDRVCSCDDRLISLTNAETDQMIDAIVSGGTWDPDGVKSETEIRAEVFAAIESCEVSDAQAPNGIIGGRIQPYLTTEHPQSSYGRPVYICDGIAYGPSDIIPGGGTARGAVDFFRHSYKGEQGVLADKFLGVAP
jgi:hypothetical protein